MYRLRLLPILILLCIISIALKINSLFESFNSPANDKVSLYLIPATQPKHSIILTEKP